MRWCKTSGFWKAVRRTSVLLKQASIEIDEAVEEKKGPKK